uniref:Polyprotein n=1 Tax=Cajanus cajan TaxID=3821 RepID=A0A151UGM7_CAJCA
MIQSEFQIDKEALQKEFSLEENHHLSYGQLISFLQKNCKKPGHISKYCRLKRKISNLNLEPELEEEISSLLVETSEENSTDDYSGEDIHNVQQDDDVSSYDSSDTANINVLTKEQDLLFEAISSISDLEKKMSFLNKLKQTLEKRPSNLVITNKYDLNSILKRLEKTSTKPVTIQDLQAEINNLKREIRSIKEQQLLNRLYSAKIFSKFDMKSGYWHIQNSRRRTFKDFLGCLNYVADFIPNLNNIIKALHDHLKKNPPSWSDNHTTSVKHVKKLVKNLPCLSLPIPQAFKIVETNASDLGYGGILKQKLGDKEHIVAYTSKQWNHARQNYSTVKKKVLAIGLCVSKFQSDLLNQNFLIKVDCKSAKEILQKDVKNLASKQILARWQAILSVFDFDIEYLKGTSNSLPDYLTREYLQGTSSDA